MQEKHTHIVPYTSHTHAQQMEPAEGLLAAVVRKHCPSAEVHDVKNVGKGRGVIRMSKIECDVDIIALGQALQHTCPGAQATLVQEGSKPLLFIKYNINAESHSSASSDSVRHRKSATISDPPPDAPEPSTSPIPATAPQTSSSRFWVIAFTILFALWLLREMTLASAPLTATSGI